MVENPSMLKQHMYWRLILALVSPVVFFCGLEVLLWIFGVNPDCGNPLKIDCGAVGPYEDYRCQHIYLEQSRFQMDPDLLWAPRPGAKPFNDLGYRGPLVEKERRSAVPRILAVGDSNTLGLQDATWTEPLQKNLSQELGTPVEVLNAGVYGYSSFQGVRRLKKFLDYHPDVILISFGTNDAIYTHNIPDSVFLERLTPLTGLARQVAQLRLMKILTCLYRYVLPSDIKEGVYVLEHRVPLDQYRANLTSMVRLAQSIGAKPILLTRPFVQRYCEYGDVYADWRGNVPQYNKIVIEVAKDLNVGFVDVDAYFSGRPYLFIDESHFTNRGHQEMADLLALEVLKAFHKPVNPAVPAEEKVYKFDAPLPFPQSSSIAPQTNPAMVFDSEGNLHTVWFELADSEHATMYYSRLKAGASYFDSVQPLIPTPVPIVRSMHGVTLVVYKKQLLMVWGEQGSSNGEIWFIRAELTTGHFSRPKKILDCKTRLASSPNMAIEDNGRIWLAWTETNSQGSPIFTTTSEDQGNTFLTPLATNFISCSASEVMVTPHRNSRSVWIEWIAPHEGQTELSLGKLVADKSGIHLNVVDTALSPFGKDQWQVNCDSIFMAAAPSTERRPIFAFVAGDSSRTAILHITSKCDGLQSRPVPADENYRKQNPSIVLLGGVLHVMIFEEINPTNIHTRLMVTVSENGGAWFTPPKPMIEEITSENQHSPYLTTGPDEWSIAVAYVLGNRAMLQFGRPNMK